MNDTTDSHLAGDWQPQYIEAAPNVLLQCNFITELLNIMQGTWRVEKKITKGVKIRSDGEL